MSRISRRGFLAASAALASSPLTAIAALAKQSNADNSISKLSPRVPITDLGIAQLSEHDIRWLRDAKFGMFIHWGLYAGRGKGEWMMHNEGILPDAYRRFAFPESGEEYFAADRYDPREWTALAKRAGMKWMCLTTRHHEGYCLFDSPHPNAFTSVQTHHRDFVKEYADACRHGGLKAGLYYSVLSWRYPGYYDITGTNCAPNPFGYKTDPAHKESARLMKEENYANVGRLMSAYGPIDHIFWDGGWLAERGSDAAAAYFHEPGHFMDPANEWPIDRRFQDIDRDTGKALGIMGIVRKHQPHAAVNPRFGWVGDIKEEEGSGKIVGPVRSTALYDKCLTTAGTWGYDREAIDSGKVMDAPTIIDYLANCVVRDMVMLLNVGPDRHGVIPDPVAQSLTEAGKWIHSADAAIYGTRGGPWNPTDGQIGYCYRDKTVFVHLLGGYSGNAITLPAVGPLNPVSAKELLSGRRLDFKLAPDRTVSIEGIDRTTSPVDTIVQIDFDQPVMSHANRITAGI